LRRGVEEKLPWPHAAAGDRPLLMALFNTLEELAKVVLKAILTSLKHQVGSDLGMLLEDPDNEFGPNVLRSFLYRGKTHRSGRRSLASSVHSDMGLVTVVPRSSWPSLQLWEPFREELVFPEDELGPMDVLVFAGETLAFLTGGVITAPLHAVPFVDTTDRRCSAPFFLRAAPEAELASPRGDSVTCRDLIERHQVLRPWKLSSHGAGDW